MILRGFSSASDGDGHGGGSNSSDPNIGIRLLEDIRNPWYSVGNMLSGVIKAFSEYFVVDGMLYISSSMTVHGLAYVPFRGVFVVSQRQCSRRTNCKANNKTSRYYYTVTNDSVERGFYIHDYD
ncbi:hypothetical protein LR48_Vigan06g004200 [Vigna angularis]|uniref:Uncharacterized protein n=1 Tax=Phaseolus angularis TaxID=3914 RepID=A0A0L9UPU3_PHAAN|nr:hypothetical protein LR48_Vigan06g004200 [Vigna angularis]